MSRFRKTHNLAFATRVAFAGAATLSFAQIQTSPYQIVGTGTSSTGVVVGANPFGGPGTAPATIDAIVIPLIIQIYDPDGTVVGVSVGRAQYIDGFVRAQFWNAPNHSRTSYTQRAQLVPCFGDFRPYQ